MPHMSRVNSGSKLVTVGWTARLHFHAEERLYFHSAASRPSLEPVECPINLYAEAKPTTRVHLVAVKNASSFSPYVLLRDAQVQRPPCISSADSSQRVCFETLVVYIQPVQ
jgi:hypothetical protein